jgi:hypothetical protein
MSYRQRIVCLASSWKHAGRCIAGKEVLPSGYGQWVRPVNARPKAGISDEERRCADGSLAVPLDILDISCEQPVPELHQVENHRIEPGVSWVKAGQLSASGLEALLDQPEQLWPNGSSSGHGLNDRVSATVAAELNGSLALIAPEDPFVLVLDEGDASARVRMEFVYRGVPYNFAVTDPSAMRAFRQKPRGRYPLAPSWLCVSLGERYEDGYCYKLAAAVHGKPE